MEKIVQEIERINNYERRWKIQTNLTKFKVIHLDRRRYPNIRLGNRIINSRTNGSMLGLELTCSGYHAHVKKIKESCERDMRKLWSLRSLGEDNKRKIFKAIIGSKLHYPPIPFHCVNKSLLTRLQRIQNWGARYITGISRMERKTNSYINVRAQLRPLNITSYERALKTWNGIRKNLRQEWEGVLTYRAPSKKSWPLSIPTVM